MTLHPRRNLSIEQYLEREDKSDDRSEYFRGEVFLMGGGTLEHNSIVFNLVAELKPTLRSGTCRLYGQDLRLWVDSYQLFTYPDLLVVCGSPKLFPGRKDTVTDASLIIEVLSPSTRDYDAGDKFKFYRSLPSFQEYLLISQDEVRVEHHFRQSSNRWLLTEFTDPKAVIPLPTLSGIHLTMGTIYEGVFSSGETPI
jgi:Uma2 family endonuclease